jgi:sulfoxide reductase heme-binding subunit YedZ
MLALLMLIPLAATSTAKAQRRLGKQWLSLHRLIYVIAILGVWHYWWRVKKDIREPLLLSYRLWKQRRSLVPHINVARVARTDAS